MPALDVLLAGYARAISDVDRPVERLTTAGIVEGVGLTGAFRTYKDAGRARSEQTLGPRTEITLRLGQRVWYADESGDVREYTGLLLRRARTSEFIESGAFASRPDRCVLRGRVSVGGRLAYALDVAVDEGEVETVYLDARTLLPSRVAYDDDDGRTSIDYSDWRTVAGRRYAFKAVASDGDTAFDTTALTTAVDPVSTIDPRVFASLVPRRIEMAAPESVDLTVRAGHLYVPVRIEGKTYTFLLDSGAENVVLDRRLATDLGLAPVGAFEASGARRTGGVRLAKLPALDVGLRGRLSNLVVSVIDLGAATDGAFRIDGVLGYPFFASATVRLDIAARTMTFGPPGTVSPQGERIALEMDRGMPEATVGLNAAVDARFLFDTGNAAEVLLYKPFVDKHPGIVPYSTTIRHSFGIGGSAESYRSSLDRIVVGNITLYHAETDVMLARRGAFADRFDAGNIGLGVLQKLLVTFDESNNAMYVARGSTFDDGRTRI